MKLYLGIDIAKSSHVAALLSPSLLAQYGTADRCPTLIFAQSRPGFVKLLAVMTLYASPCECAVLVEDTGHYGRALEQYLQEKGVEVYRIHVQREKRKQKSDKRDARALSVAIYNQVECGILVSEKSQALYRLTTPNETVRLLQCLVQHRLELVRETTRRKNKLTAIADEVFPELTAVYKDPNGPSALILREKFPSPHLVAEASLADLVATRKRTRPSRAQFEELQLLARTTIGTKDTSRLIGLLLEQQQLIAELALLSQHVETLNTEIEKAVVPSREGQILLSFCVIGPVQTAILLAAMGSIANFPSAAKLRGYCGWTPMQTQTGTSYDTMSLTHEGNRLLKYTLYLIVLTAIRLDTPWKTLYDRLVPRVCRYDERLGCYHGKMKVIGRIAGQLIKVMYVLLKKDYDLLSALPPGETPPPPELYDAKKHHVKPLPKPHD